LLLRCERDTAFAGSLVQPWSLYSLLTVIAAQALQTAVQEPWVEGKAEDNTPFYRNTETGEIVFTSPNDEVFADLFKREKAKRAQRKVEAASRGLQVHGAQPARGGRHSLEQEGGDGRDESQESDMDSDEVRLGTRVVMVLVIRWAFVVFLVELDDTPCRVCSWLRPLWTAPQTPRAAKIRGTLRSQCMSSACS